MKKFFREHYVLVIGVIILVLFQIKLPYYVDTPGGTIDISDRIVYDGMKEYNGSLNMLYVTEYVATIPTYLLSYVIKDWDLEDMSLSQISNESVDEIEYRNKIMLKNSINTAKYVAYKEASKEVKEKSNSLVVIGVTLDNGFKIGDEILEVNGNKATFDLIKEEINKRNVGDSLSFKVKRKNKEINVKSSIAKDKTIGVVIVNNYEYEFSPDVTIKFKDSESGASGGMMMTLSIYCAISGEDLLKGRDIAGTGTIDMDGNVGKIDGIKYKLIGAYRKGMDVVLVPSGNYKEAVKVARERKFDMDIVEVKTFKDVINYLKSSS